MRLAQPAAADGPPLEDRHWALFADWCTATDRCPLPATPETILAFLAELTAGPATIRRRLQAVDAAHRNAGYPPPSAGPPFDALLRPPRPARFDPALVAAALAIIPIGGWPVGIVGRRDAALVALVCSAGLTRRQIQALRTSPAGSSDVPGTGPVGEWTPPAIAPTDDPGPCPACALTRWQWAAATTATAGWRTVRNVLADLGEDTANSESSHDCARTAGSADVTDDDQGARRPPAINGPVPLFCAIDRHGTPQTGYPLSTRSITAIVAGRLAAAHAGLQRVTDAPNPAVMRAAWASDDHARVVADRHAATERLASFEADLDEADAYAEAVMQRLDAALSGAHAPGA